MNFERYEYDDEGDVLDVYFDDKHFHQRQPIWAIELTPNIMIAIDREQRKAMQLTLMDYSELARSAEGVPDSFPIVGLANLPQSERHLVLSILNSSPVDQWLDISTVQMLPDSPFTITHLEPPPSALQELMAVPA